jgi:transposase
MEEQKGRYIGLDAHKSYCMVGAVNAQQEVVLAPRRVAMSHIEDWAQQQLRKSDEVVLEASGNAWDLYDLLEPLVARVRVVHPQHVKLIAASVVKTDKRDTLVLARLLAAHLVPEIWVPPRHVRELRDLVGHRQRLMQARTAAKNRLQAILLRHKLEAPPGDLYGPANQGWWAQVALAPTERLRVHHFFETIQRLNGQLQETEQAMAQLSASSLWRTEVTLLVQLPGIGMLNAMTILSAVGDIKRFATAKKLVGYAGLGARVHASGQINRQGGLTKQGRGELRVTLIEAAWTAVTFSKSWKKRFDPLAARIGKLKAITAIARKLLVVIWHVLTEQTADREADVMAVRRSLQAWASRFGLATALGLKRSIFVQQALELLGLVAGRTGPRLAPMSTA